ncbi:MAG: hypothetical protein KAX49_05305, partial [Halanaerobiales bacterium]|nr:hypothetical protein [Halanaerobiales bacterium]
MYHMKNHKPKDDYMYKCYCYPMCMHYKDYNKKNYEMPEYGQNMMNPMHMGYPMHQMMSPMHHMGYPMYCCCMYPYMMGEQMPMMPPMMPPMMGE